MSMEDKAQEHEALEWEQRNLNRTELPNYALGHPLYGPAECIECEAELHPVRRAMGKRHCVECTNVLRIKA